MIFIFKSNSVKRKKYINKYLIKNNFSLDINFIYGFKFFIFFIISVSFVYLYLIPSYNNKSLIKGYNYKNDFYKALKCESKPYFRANLINGKLYWNNETSLKMDEINAELSKFKKLNISFEKKENFIRRKNPKVSVVITLNNRDKYIKLVYNSIYIQELKDIEIIFVDDASNDNTSSIINELMIYDKRIIYLKNDINKRAFYSRCRGILEAKGEYVIVIDSDDILINNILIKAYETAKKFDLDIVHFYIISGSIDGSKKYLARELKYKSGILSSPSEIKNNFYHTISRNLWDKFVRRETYVKSIKFMREEFYNQIYIWNSDDTSFFGLLNTVQSYGFLEEIGYLYVIKPKGTYIYKFDPKNSNLLMRGVFNNMNYFYVQSDNSTLEKTNLAYKYFEKNIAYLENNLRYLTEGFGFIEHVLELYLNSSFFSVNQINKLKNFKIKFDKRKSQFNNNTKIILFS